MNKKIIQANKLIAEFMCPNLQKEIDEDSIILGEGMMVKAILYAKDYRLLNYDTSWTWIMKVVEKIETLKFHPRWTVEYRVVIKRNFCQIDIGEGTIGNDGTFVNVDDTKILAVHGAVVKFIEWYSNITK